MDEIKKELQIYQEVLEEEMTEDPVVVEARGAELSVILARTGKILADAKQAYNKARTEEIMDYLKMLAADLNASYTTQNALVKSAAHREQQIVDWAERIHKTTARQMDWCRTVLSKAKEDERRKFSQVVHN